MEMEKANQVAIVTGGASGIGKAIGWKLAEQGVFVIIADLDEDGGRESVAQMVRKGQKARFAKLDVTETEQVEQLVEGVYKEFGRLDYMFNNAGIAMYGEVHQLTTEHWERILNVNLWGVIHGTQAAYRIMKKQGFGHIANTASATGLGPSPTAAAYATTKHAIVGLTTSLHYEAEAYGVKVSALCPAFVDTPIFAKGEAVGMDRNMIIEQMKKQKPMSPDKFAALAIKGLEKNQSIICPMPLRRTMDITFILFPALHRSLMRLVCKVARAASIEEQPSGSSKQSGISAR